MNTIIFAFIFTFFMACIGKNSFGETRTINISNKHLICHNGSTIIYWCLCVFLACIAGFRKGFVDTNSYRNIYETVGKNFSMVFDENLRIESGFRFICFILNYITNNSQILLIVVSLFVTFAIFKFVNNYSVDRWLSVVIFFLTSFLTTMNTMRQYIVVGVLLLCIPLLLKGKWRLFLLISLLLSTIHSTAIFAGIVIALSKGKVFNKRMVIISMVILVLAFLPAEGFVGVLQAVDIQDYADMYSELGKSGINIFRLAVQAVPVLLALFYFRIYGKDSMGEDYSMFTNLSILNLLIYILSMQSNYIARIALYFEVFNLVTIPFFLSTIIKKGQVYYAKAIALSLYSIYFYFVVQGFGVVSINMLTPFFIGG